MKICPLCCNAVPEGTHCPVDGAALTEIDRHDPIRNRILKQQYKVEEPIGSGGLGMVYRGTQLSLNRSVAIKVLKLTVADTADALQRFLREARLLSKLNHPHVINVLDFGHTEDGLAFLVMELIRGDTLRNIVDITRGLQIETISSITQQICSGLRAAHESSIVHRDLKPVNIMLAEISGGSTLVKILDFGISRSADTELEQQTQTGMIVGTPGFLSPEQINGLRGIDPRSDIYALGAVLYYMITGRPPYTAESSAAVIGKQLTEQPAPIIEAELHDPRAAILAPVVMRAMALDPEARFQTVDAFQAAIEDILAEKDPSFLNRPTGAGFRVSSVQSPSERIRAEKGAAPSSVTAYPQKKYLRRYAALGLGVLALAATAGIADFGEFGSTAPPANTAGSVRGITPNQVTVGISAPFSGPAKELGRAVKLGIDLYFTIINSEGGVNGRSLRLVSLDDRYDPAAAASNAERLIERERVFAVLGNVGTAPLKAALPKYLDNHAIVFGSLTGADVVRLEPPDRYVFNLRASYAEETAAMINYFIKQKRIAPNQIAVFQQNDTFGDSGFNGVAKVLRGYNVEPESIPRVRYERNSNRIEDAVKALSALQQPVSAVVIIGTYGASARFTQLYRGINPDCIFANVSFVGSDALREEFAEVDPAAGKGVIVTEVVPRWDSHSSVAVQFRHALHQYFPNESPSSVTLEGFLAAKLFVEGLKRSGKNPTADTFADAVEGMSGIDLGTGSQLTFGLSDHQGSDKIWAIVLDENGAYQPLDLAPDSAG